MPKFNNLRDVFDAYSGDMKDLTVLAPQNDPFRVDTDTGHRDGSWLADTLAQLNITGQRHLRGLHYILVGGSVIKPNGLPVPDGPQTTRFSRRWIHSRVRSAEFDHVTFPLGHSLQC
jgi:hypothetical protein